MRRRAVFIAILAGLLALTAAPAPAQTVFPVKTVLGRRVVYYTAGTAAWHASAQIQYVDTNGNGIADAENSRCAVLEDAGISRVRVTNCLQQQKVDTNGNNIPDTWVNRMVNDIDAVGASFAASLTPTVGFCRANPALQRWMRARNFHVVRRASDSALFYRSLFSRETRARALNDDPGCKPSADLAITKTITDIQDPEGGDVIGPIAAVDDTFLVQIKVTNPAGGATATDVDVTDDWPTDLDPAQPGNRCTANATTGDVACSITYIEPGQSHTFTIVGRTNGSTGASFDNTASLVQLDQPDPNLANNTVTVTQATS
jgi:Domain of unknown function DUF11